MTSKKCLILNSRVSRQQQDPFVVRSPFIPVNTKLASLIQFSKMPLMISAEQPTLPAGDGEARCRRCRSRCARQSTQPGHRAPELDTDID